MNLGADVVMVDVLDDFTIDPDLLAAAITPRTKAIIPVDMGGLPAHYDRIMAVAEAARASFAPSTERQAKLGRPLVVTDAAHSIGATYRGVQNGNQADATVFSLHSVKNVTTGEGGAICLNLPAPFDNAAELRVPPAPRPQRPDQERVREEPDRRMALRHHRPGPQGEPARPGCRRRARPDAEVLERAPARTASGSSAATSTASAAQPWAILPIMARRGARVVLPPLPAARSPAPTRRVATRSSTTSRRRASASTCTTSRCRCSPCSASAATRWTDYPVTFGLYQNEITLPLYNGLTDDQVDEVVRVVTRRGRGDRMTAAADLRPRRLHRAADHETHRRACSPTTSPRTTPSSGPASTAAPRS